MPTPPPPPPPPEESRTPRVEKKERPRVVRGEAAGSSWGFWGTAPAKASHEVDGDRKKKEHRTRDPVVNSADKAPRPAGLTRSKSARKVSDRDAGGSGGSEKARLAERPTSSRGMSFSGFFGRGATSTPGRSKSTRHTEQDRPRSSRRHSVAAVEKVSPQGASEEPIRVSSKAAQVMGIVPRGKGLSRSHSTREKGSRAVPDPYPIEDDVDVVNGSGDAPVSHTVSRAKSGPGKESKSRSKRPSHAPSAGADDPVHLVGEDASLDPRVVDGPESRAFVVQRPPPLKRSSTNAQPKRGGGLMGLMRSLSTRDARPSAEDRHRSRPTYNNDEDSFRKRADGHERIEGKHLRRDGRRVHRSGRGDYPPDIPAPNGRSAPADDVEAEVRRAERGARRADREGQARAARDAQAAEEEEEHTQRRKNKEKAVLDERKMKARDVRDRHVSEVDAGTRGAEEQRTRRATKEERGGRKREVEEASGQRLREKDARKADLERAAREREAEEAREILRQRQRDRDAKRAEAERAGVKVMPKVSKVATGAAVDDGHDTRENGWSANQTPAVGDTSRRKPGNKAHDYYDGHQNDAPPEQAPYIIGEKGKTTKSWVQQVVESDPLPPPVEDTVIEPKPERLYAGGQRDHNDPERRRHRKLARAAAPREHHDAGRDRRKGHSKAGAGGRGSDGSGESAGVRNVYDRYAGYEDYAPPPPVRTFDGKLGDTGRGKRTSWLKKIPGFG